VERELAERPDEAEAAALAPFGGASALCERLRDGTIDPLEPAVLKAVRLGVLARLSVDNPRYATFARLKERDIA
jgi:hypothetical protein